LKKIEAKKNSILIAGEVEIYPEAIYVHRAFGVEEKRAGEIGKCVRALHIMEGCESQVILKLAEKFVLPNEFLFAVWLCGWHYQRMEIKSLLVKAGVPADFLW